MFYYVMRADGVHWRRAFAMYVAVAVFGPKWGSDGNRVTQTQEMTEANKDDFDRRLSNLIWRGIPAYEGDAFKKIHAEFGITE